MRVEPLIPWLVLTGLSVCGQSFEQRGSFEMDLFGFPLAAPNDSGQIVGNALLRWDASYKPWSWIAFSASSWVL